MSAKLKQARLCQEDKMEMNILELFSIKGFVEYYNLYLANIKEVKHSYRVAKRAKRKEDCSENLQEHMELTNEMLQLARKYACICTVQELKEALVAYPEGSKEHEGVVHVWREKQKQLKILNEYFNM